MLRNLLFKLTVLFCLAVPFNSAAQSNPEDWWVVVGYTDGAWGTPFLARIFENEVTGEQIIAFCMQAAPDQPGDGERYYLHANGIWLIPEDNSKQIMYIFKSECDYETPELEPSEDCLPFGGPITLTTTCVQGEPVWYSKAAWELTEVGRGNSYTTNISWGHYYVRCENNDATCFSEYAHVNLALDYATPDPKPSKTNVCIGEEVDLSFEPGCGSYQYLGYYDKWYLDANYTMPVSGSVVLPTTTTTYYLRCVSLSGCTANLYNGTSSVIIEVNPSCTAPCTAPNPTVTGDLEICQGESTSLTASGCTGGYTYLWSNNATTASITVNEGGTYTVKCVQASRPTCESLTPGSATVTVNPLPTITAGTPVCAANGLTYSVSFNITSGATITSSSGTVSGSMVSGVNAGTTIMVTVTDVNGCVNTTTVTQNCTIPCTAPNPTISGDLSICEGETTTLTASDCSSGFTYSWSTGATTQSIVVNTEDTYTVKCVSSTNPYCESTTPGSATVVVNPIPTIIAATPVCAPDGLTYSVTFTIPDGATITTTSGTVTGNVVSGIPSGVTVTITVTSAEGCTNTTTVMQNCTVPCNAPNPTVTGDLEICEGENTTLTASGCTIGYTYLWSTNATTAAITVTTSGTYTVKCVETGRPECESTTPGSATVVVNLIPTITAATPVCAPDGQTYSVTFTIPAGATITTTAGTVTGNVVSGIPSGVTATITVTSAEGCTNTTTVMQNCTVPVFDLALRKVLANGAKNPTVTPGSTVTFKIEVWNQGNVDAQNVEVIDYIPNGLTLVADANWTAGTGVATLTTPIATLAAGDSTSVNISFTVNAGFSGSIRNFAEISDADNTEGLEDIDSTPDSNLDNDGTPKDDNISEDHKNNPTEDEDDHDYEDITVSPTPVFDLALRKVLANGAKNPTVTPGSTVTFKIEVWNQGNVDAQNVAVIDYIPNGLTLVADGNWTAGTGVATLTTPIATLAAGDSTSVNISFTVNAGFSGSIRNFAEISDADNTEGLEDIDSTPDSNPDNDGTPKDDNISEDHKSNPTEDEDDHDYEDITVSPTPVFDLALRKVLANGAKNPTVTPGSTVTFKIEVWNQGNVDAQNVAVIDYIPNGLTLVADGNWTAGTGVATLTTPIATLAAGDSTSVNISFTVNAGFSGSIRNFAEISDADNTEGLEDIDSTPDSNPDNDGTPKDDNISEDHKNNPTEDEDDHDYEDITVSPTPVFDLALRKTMAPGSKTIYKVGDEVTFNITVFNQGNVVATSVDLVDYIPEGLTLKAGSDWILDGDKGRWTGAITNLAAGAQEVVTITFVVNSSATGVIINTAEISGATNPENLEDIDSTPDDDKDNDDPVKNDEINEDGKNNPNDDEDDHDIEPITICTDGKCITARVNKKS